MSKQYWLFCKETLIVNQTAINARKVACQDQIPRTALLKQPKIDIEGFQVCAVLDDNCCAIDSEYVEDHRGKTIYNTQDCTQLKTVEKLGTIDEYWTLLKPTTRFDEWVDAWVTNESLQYKAELLQVESNRRSLYVNVDALRSEAEMHRLQDDEASAVEYDTQAVELYLKIRADNPWPVE